MAQDKSHSLGQRIRELRLAKGITQIDLARGICTPSMISQIESDRARPSYKILFQIADSLNAPLAQLLANTEPGWESVSSYKMSRALIAAEEYEAAVPLLREMLENPRQSLVSLEILFELGECYLHMGAWEEAEEVLKRVQAEAALRQERPMLAQVLKNMGVIEFHRKRYQVAIYQWQKALDLMDSGEEDEADPLLRGELLLQLGHANCRLGHLLDAMGCYRRAAVLYSEGGQLEKTGEAYRGLADTHKQLRDYEQASGYADLAFGIYEELENLRQMIRLELERAILFGESGQREKALALFRQVIGKYRELGYEEDEGMAHVELAKLHLAAGDDEAAEEACAEGRSLLPEQHLYRAWIDRVMGRIALQRNRHEDAVCRLAKAAQHFRNGEEIREWDLSLYELSRVYADHGDMDQAYRTMLELYEGRKQALDARGIVL